MRCRRRLCPPTKKNTPRSARGATKAGIVTVNLTPFLRCKAPIWPRSGLGILACLFYGVHGAHHVADQHPENLLWVCHVGALLVGFGLIWGLPTVNAVGFLWLSVGVVLWTIDLATGGQFFPTSTLTHVGGLLIAIYGLKVFGMPKHVWWKALAGILIMQQISRWTTSPEFNVNLSFGVWAGWENWFVSYHSYMLILLCAAAALFFAIEFTLRKLSSFRQNELECRSK